MMVEHKKETVMDNSQGEIYDEEAIRKDRKKVLSILLQSTVLGTVLTVIFVLLP